MAIKIYVDMGHNPRNPNAGAEGNGYKEHDITYDIGRRLAALLNADPNFEAFIARRSARNEQCHKPCCARKRCQFLGSGLLHKSAHQRFYRGDGKRYRGLRLQRSFAGIRARRRHYRGAFGSYGACKPRYVCAPHVVCVKAHRDAVGAYRTRIYHQRGRRVSYGQRTRCVRARYL